ncbi:MAG: DUF6174 domain-containing protein [Bacteroidota bacterium]|nr:DUF6174 domain-containing protein [Bacteroidota bacterium]
MKYLFKILILFFTLACSSEDSITPNPIEMELSAAIKMWNDSNINSYSYTLTVSCYCIDTEPNDIKVVDNKIKKVNGKLVTENDLENIYWNVKSFDEIFEIIAEKLNDNPFLYTIKFDQSFGYPIDIYFDMDEMIADEEIGYYVTNFKIE